jgi:hypothetical protein
LENFLTKNLQEPGISKVIVHAEGISEVAQRDLENRFTGISIASTNRRPSFSDLLQAARDAGSPDQLIAICNSDIWLRNSSNGLRVIRRVLSSNPHYVLTLTRRDDVDHRRLLSVSGILPELASSDAWIFYGRPRSISLNENVKLGVKDLEHHVNTALAESGYTLANACYHLEAVHLESTQNDYEAFSLTDFASSTTQSIMQRLSLASTKCILPLPLEVEGQQLGAVNRTLKWQEFHDRFICLDLAYATKEAFLYTLNSLCHFGVKYGYTICIYSHEAADEWASRLLNDLASAFPRLILQIGDSVASAIQCTSEKDFAIVSHCGIITRQMLEEGMPIYVLGIRHEMSWSTSSLGTSGIPSILCSPSDNIQINESGYFWSNLQLITCTFRSGAYIEEFLSNAHNLCLYSHAQHVHIVHSLIDISPPDNLVAKVISYLKSTDGFYLILTADPGLYGCWNRLIKLSSEEYVSNANPDDLRSPGHCSALVGLLSTNPDALVASSSVFPIFTRSERGMSIEYLQEREGAGWFSDVPETYGLDFLYEPHLDEEGLIVPRNVPHCAPVWRRELHHHHGFFQEDRYGSEADWALWCKYASNGGKFLHCNESLSGYYVDELSYGRQRVTSLARIDVITNILAKDGLRHSAAEHCSKLLVEYRISGAYGHKADSFLYDQHLSRDDLEIAAYSEGELSSLHSAQDIDVNKVNAPIVGTRNSDQGLIKIDVYGAHADYGQHRFSNNDILKTLLAHHSDSADIQFIWFLEKYFLWGTDPGERNSDWFRPITKPWIGVLHVPPLTPSWAGNQFSELFVLKEWNESLSSCRGLIALSEYMQADLEKLYPNVPVYSVKHPMPGIPTLKFDLSQFLSDPKLVLSGYWLRNHIGFYKWKAPFRKIHLLKSMSKDLMNREFSFYGSPTADELSSVEKVEYLPDIEYDSLLSCSMFYLDMYETSANNAILECIAAGAPFISRRLPAIEEYVGRDYPLFIDEQELGDLGAHELLRLAGDAHHHLMRLASNDVFSLDIFRRRILAIAT